MDLKHVHRLVDRVAGAGVGARDEVCAALGLVSSLRSWVDAQEVRLAAELAAVSAMPTADIAAAQRCSGRAAERAMSRAQIVGGVPELGEALLAGEVTGEHIDVVERELRRVEPVHRPVVLNDVALLAAGSSPEQLAQELRRRARRAATDDGVDRLCWQQGQVRLSSSQDTETGLTNWWLVTDPLTTVRLEQAIHARLEALFHDSTPQGCPVDLRAKQQFLRAHAMFSLLGVGEGADTAAGRGSRTGRPEIIVVVDTRDDEHGVDAQVIDWGLPVEIPARVLHELAGRAEVHPVVVRNGVVLHAPGVLDLGRSTRIANRAQRRALRGLYSGCAVPGCTARFDHCTIHHVIWWRHGGPTDLANLLPLCSKHHHLVHEGGWQLKLTPDRVLTITLPDGREMTTGPPRRVAA
jgi:hypothetical protein